MIEIVARCTTCNKRARYAGGLELLAVDLGDEFTFPSPHHGCGGLRGVMEEQHGSLEAPSCEATMTFHLSEEESERVADMLGVTLPHVKARREVETVEWPEIVGE